MFFCSNSSLILQNRTKELMMENAPSIAPIKVTMLTSGCTHMQDELLWAASWLYIATLRSTYLKYITDEAISNSVDEFN
ncbi:Glycoside hydrolase, family 9 [Cinnamomum micranthum f. kanehirae]|uniref:cellulase n=1 Tax=Cinnamomum micranthum f. kanehirae TaxID=337451 RepID=A0A443P2I5_9MAGN|nr:Glycoside hydrolase, family 9 [Cinnamomum micranthum f. kanehirae]